MKLHFSRMPAWLEKSMVTGLATLFVAGCGGSSGVAGVSYTLPAVPTDPVQITAGNSQTVSADALSATVGAMEAGYGGPSGVAARGGSGHIVKSPLERVIRRTNRILMEQRDATPLVAGASYVLFCNDVDDANGTIKLTAVGNDSRIDYNNCDIWGDGSIVFDGALAATKVSYSGDPYFPPFSLSATYSYNLTFSYNSGAEVITMMGRFNLSMSDDGTTYTSTTTDGEMGMITGSGAIVMTSMSSSESCNAHYGYSWDYECYGTLTTTSNYTAAGTLSNGSFTVSTKSPIVYDMSYAWLGVDVYPESGQIQVDGANNSQIVVTIYDDNYDDNGAVADDLGVFVDPDTRTVDGDEATYYFTWASIFA